MVREERYWVTLLPDDIRAIRRAAQGPLPDDATPEEKHWRKMFEEEPKRYRKDAVEDGEQVQEKFRTARWKAATG